MLPRLAYPSWHVTCFRSRGAFGLFRVCGESRFRQRLVLHHQSQHRVARSSRFSHRNGQVSSLLAVEPSGHFAYVANSGSDTVSAYTINAGTGLLTPIGLPIATGQIPFSVAVEPLGHFAYVANISSDNVSAYTINATTGALKPIAGSPFKAGSNPVSIVTAK